MDYSLLGSSVHGIFQARMLEWTAIFLGELPNLGIGPGTPELQAVTCIAGGFFTDWATRKAPVSQYISSFDIAFHL